MADIRRVCDKFNINIAAAEKLIKDAKTDAGAKAKLAPLRLGKIKRWTNGCASTADEPVTAFSERDTRGQNVTATYEPHMYCSTRGTAS